LAKLQPRERVLLPGLRGRDQGRPEHRRTAAVQHNPVFQERPVHRRTECAAILPRGAHRGPPWVRFSLSPVYGPEGSTRVPVTPALSHWNSRWPSRRLAAGPARPVPFRRTGAGKKKIAQGFALKRELLRSESAVEFRLRDGAARTF